MSLVITTVQPVVNGKVAVQSRWFIVEPHNGTACKWNSDNSTAHRETVDDGQHHVKLYGRSSLCVLRDGGRGRGGGVLRDGGRGGGGGGNRTGS